MTGAKVTLRNDKMFQFIDFLVTLVLPRVKNFEGIQDQKPKFPRELNCSNQRPFHISPVRSRNKPI